MKRITLYHIGTALLLMSQTAYAVKFDIKKGFVYEEKEIEEQKTKAIEEKLSKPMVKVVRLFNEDNKISDPVLKDQNQQPQEIQFAVIKDKTKDAEVQHENAAREVASLNGNMDWLAIEKNLLEAESQFGIRSMPVVQFTSIDKLDKNSFAHRVEFLETKLGIEAESKQISAIPQRLLKIKQKLNVETEVLGLDLNI